MNDGQKTTSTADLDAFLYLLLAAVTLPLGQAFNALPWGAQLPGYTLPLALLVGVACGVVAFSMRSGLLAVFLVSISGLLGCLALIASAHVALATSTDPGLLVLGVCAGFVGAFLPFCLLLGSEWWVTLPLALVSLVGWHGEALSGSQWAWIIVLVVLTSLLLAGARRRRSARWEGALTTPQRVSGNRGRQGRQGEYARGSAPSSTHRIFGRWLVWSIAAALALAALGMPLASIAQPQIPALQNAWRDSPIQHQGPLTSSAVRTTPTLQLGAGLALTAPPLHGATTLLTYTMMQPRQDTFTPLPLLVTTFDTYSSGQWSLAGSVSTPWPGISPSLDTPLAVAQVTLLEPLHIGDQVVLPGLSRAISYSLPSAQPRVARSSSSRSGSVEGMSSIQATLATTDWVVAARAAAPGTAYTVTALAPDATAAAAAVASGSPSQDPAAYGWDSASYSRLRDVPLALAATLRADAVAWSTPQDPTDATGTLGAASFTKSTARATTAVQQAQALSDTLQHQMTLLPGYQPPSGDAAIADFLATRRGNAATYVTTFVLLLRALGYPTRIAEGFMPSSANNLLPPVSITASDLTYWAQIALPGYGWFDVLPLGTHVPISPGSSANAPTTSGSAGSGRSSSASATPTPTPTPEPSSPPGTGSTSSSSATSPTSMPPSSPLTFLRRRKTPPTLILAGVLLLLILVILFVVLIAVAYGNLLWIQRRTKHPKPARYRAIAGVLRSALRVAVLGDIAHIPVGATPDQAADYVARGLGEKATHASRRPSGAGSHRGRQRQTRHSEKGEKSEKGNVGAGAADGYGALATILATGADQVDLDALSPHVAQAIQALYRLTEEYQQGRFGSLLGSSDFSRTLTHNDLEDARFALLLALLPYLARTLGASLARGFFAPRRSRAPAAMLPENGAPSRRRSNRWLITHQ